MILVTGATGFIGRHLVVQLQAERLPVRCLVAEHQIASVPWDTGAEGAPEIITGHVMDEEALFRAVTGVHTIIHLESAMWWGRERDLERIEVAGTRNLLLAARAARVGRVITLSHLGAAPSSAYTLHRIKGQMEEVVRSSGLAYTIIRSGIVYGEGDAFIDHIAMMLSANPFFFLMPGRGEVVLHPVYIDDLIKAIMNAQESLNAIDRTIDMGGLEYATLDDLLRTVMRVTGKHRFIISVPPYLLRWIANIYALIFPRALVTPQWLDILATNRTAPLSNTYENFGFQPRRFEDTLVTYLPQERHFFKLLRYVFQRRPRSI